MEEVLDLRQFRGTQLDALLRAETDDWRRDLDWDYGPSAQLIRQYVEARILAGYVLCGGSGLAGLAGLGRQTARGYGFFIYEATKGLVGDLYVAPEYRRAGFAAERQLLTHMLETMQATPGLNRIEAQLMAYRPEDLFAGFAEFGMRAYRRLFLRLDLAGWPAMPETGSAAAVLRPWSEDHSEAAARLLLQAYRGHVDSFINDQYLSFAGGMRFLHNLAHYPGCGLFDAGASRMAFCRDSGALTGMILVSRVKPEVGHITQICVHPDRQGNGLGRQLLGAALDALAGAGLRAATLTVTRENQSACRLYDRLGFATLRDFDAWVWERNPTV